MVSGERVLLIAAEPRELAGIVKFCREVAPLTWPVHWARSAKLNERRVVMVANGAGAARAAQAVEAARASIEVGLVCSVGFCGAVGRQMKAGDVFVAERVRTNGCEYAARTPESKLSFHRGTLESIDHVAATEREKSEFCARGAGAVDMEAGAVAAKAKEMGISFYCIRTVTDLANENLRLDFNAALRPDGRFDTMHLIAASCRRPLHLFPELVRLGWRSHKASRKLGEFIADCRF